MPFRIAASLAIVAVLLASILILPLVWPVAELEDTRAPEALAGAGDRFLEATGVTLRARAALEAGNEAPALLLLHGFARSAMDWHHWIEELSGEARLVAYDRPGFGLSARPTSWTGRNPYGPEAEVAQALAVMDAFDLERATVVGHSSGAALALRLALAHPERVEGLVLIGPIVGEGSASRTPTWLLRSPQLERIGPLLMRRMGGEAGVSFLESAYADPERMDAAVLRAHERATTVHDWDRGLWEVVKASRAELGGSLDGVAAPALVLSGTEDAVVPPDAARTLAERLPAARFEPLDGCGHAAHEACAERALQLVRPWLTPRGE